MPIQKILDCSTGHLSAKTRAWLDGPAGDRLPIRGDEYGWFMSTSLLDLNNPTPLPGDLANILRVAQENDVSYIVFDADASVIAELPWYDDGDEPVDHPEVFSEKTPSGSFSLEVEGNHEKILTDGDYAAPEGIWVGVNDVSVRITPTEEGVSIKAYHDGKEMDDPIEDILVENDIEEDHSMDAIYHPGGSL